MASLMHCRAVLLCTAVGSQKRFFGVVMKHLPVVAEVILSGVP